LSEGAREVYLPLAPVPAARPRVSRWGTYYPKTYAKWRKDAAELLDAHKGRYEPWECPVFCFVAVGAKRPAKPANPYPVPDVDNYAKAILDASQKCGWLFKDDKQVQALFTSKRYVSKGEQPYSYLAMYDNWDDLVTVVYLNDTEETDGNDVYDLPEVCRTPLHLLEDE
jgi:Holliday junction resolvase RusA-like endonuclease